MEANGLYKWRGDRMRAMNILYFVGGSLFIYSPPFEQYWVNRCLIPCLKYLMRAPFGILIWLDEKYPFHV